MKSLFAVMCLVVAAPVFADQCAYVTKQQAKKAVIALINAKEIHELCEPCGETVAQKVVLKSIAMNPTNYQGTYEVTVNGKGIDAAYTYVNKSNLAFAVGCPASDVSRTLK
ncbi:MAG: hypothetical protein K2P81_07030 [Bacteriovoracaceae bacterium]|nr:hypothetical protein [Bacteriovoracaceae bacterium]